MALFGMTKEFNTFDDMFLFQLNDLYDAEQRILEALPKMRESAKSTSLKQAFEAHLEQTKRQASRLEEIFHDLGKEHDGVTCEGIKGIISEGDEICDASGDADVKDAGLIGAAQRVEHYEIAAYGTARTFAQRLGHQNAARLLQQTLEEEGETDKKLTQLAEQSVNVKASGEVPR